MSTAAIRRATAASIAAGLLTLAAIASTAGASTAEAGLAGLELAQVQQANCRVLLAGATSSGQRNRANVCIADQQVIIDRLTAASPSPSSSPSVQPSASPSPSATTDPPVSSPPVSPSVSPSLSPSLSPSPSPTAPPPTGLTNCFAQLDVCGYPTAENTGVQDGIVLTRTSGVMDITVAGTVLENREHTGCIYVHAANVTIRNVRLLMGDSCFYGISSYDVPSSGPLTIDNTEVICTWAHGSALAGPNFRATRVYLSGCENGAEINDNSQISDSYIAASEEGNSKAHGDGLQAQSGSNIVVRHNTFAGLNPITASIITNPTQNSHWLVEDNLMGAGAYTFYCPEDPAQGDFVVRNNRFYPYKNAAGQKLYELGDNHAPAYGQTDACVDSRITWTGNYQDNDLRTVPAGGLN